MAEKMIIGKDLSISRLVKTILETPPHQTLIPFNTNWTILALELKTSNETIGRIWKDLLSDKIGLDGVVSDLLVDWVLRTGKGGDNPDTTLGEFIRVLEGEEKLGCYADALRNEFMIDQSATTTSIGNTTSQQEGPQSLHQQRSDHIKKHLSELIRFTLLNPSVTAHLYAGGVLSDEDLDELDCQQSTLQKNTLFYKMMQGRPEHYDKLIGAFEESMQNGACELLKRGF